jgi:hypothetical protein
MYFTGNFLPVTGMAGPTLGVEPAVLLAVVVFSGFLTVTHVRATRTRSPHSAAPYVDKSLPTCHL